jgi:hypothetical protein
MWAHQSGTAKACELFTKDILLSVATQSLKPLEHPAANFCTYMLMFIRHTEAVISTHLLEPASQVPFNASSALSLAPAAFCPIDFCGVQLHQARW